MACKIARVLSPEYCAVLVSPPPPAHHRGTSQSIGPWNPIVGSWLVPLGFWPPCGGPVMFMIVEASEPIDQIDHFTVALGPWPWSFDSSVLTLDWTVTMWASHPVRTNTHTESQRHTETQTQTHAHTKTQTHRHTDTNTRAPTRTDHTHTHTATHRHTKKSQKQKSKNTHMHKHTRTHKITDKDTHTHRQSPAPSQPHTRSVNRSLLDESLTHFNFPFSH